MVARASQAAAPDVRLQEYRFVSLAEQIEHLFAKTAGPAGRPATLQEIVDRMAERGISTMSLSYLQQLRTGQAQNPRLQHLRALADVFDVPLGYFFEEEASEPSGSDGSPDEGPAGRGDSADLTSAERDVALRVHGLSDDALDSISAIVEFARKRENLDDFPPT